MNLTPGDIFSGLALIVALVQVARRPPSGPHPVPTRRPAKAPPGVTGRIFNHVLRRVP